MGRNSARISEPTTSGCRIELVPSKGLEPPHPCGYMDLNHARLPIPPRWPGYDCGSFRHFGRSGTDLADHKARLQERTASPFYRGVAGCQTAVARRSVRIPNDKGNTRRIRISFLFCPYAL